MQRHVPADYLLLAPCLVMVLNESLRGGIAPSRDQGLPDGRIVGVAKTYDGGPSSTPHPSGRLEDVRFSVDQRRLLIRC